MEMTTKERFQRMYEHKEADRVPFLDYAWNEAVERWRTEGLPTDDYLGYLGLDRIASIGGDNGPRFPEVILKEDENSITRTTSWGVTQRVFKHNTTTPENLHFTVTTPDEWRKAKERMVPTDDRINWAYLKANYKKWRDEGRWIIGGLWFGFDITHSHMVGTETLLVAMMEEPEWCMEMFEHELDVSLALLEKIWDAGYEFDEVNWPDDMGYKGTQFFSIDVYREMLKPLQKRAVDWAHAHNCKARLHSCGCIRPFVPELVEIGMDGLNPLEVKAGMDPLELKKTFGDKLTLHGGLNAVLWERPEELMEEMKRIVPVLKENGGFIFGTDHSIPPCVSFADFQRAMELYKKLASY